MSPGILGLRPGLVLVYVGVTNPQNRVLELRDSFFYAAKARASSNSTIISSLFLALECALVLGVGAPPAILPPILPVETGAPPKEDTMPPNQSASQVKNAIGAN